MSRKKKHISLIVIGHVNSGLSTTSGRLIYENGLAGPEELQKHEKVGDDTIGAKYSWVLEKLKADREREETIDDKLWKFETTRYQISIVDTPGHRDFMRNMITGITKADAALLLVDATPAAFRIGLEGQTSAHLKLVYQLGINQLVIGVNKMDALEVNYSQERFQEVVSSLEELLPQMGLTIKKIPIIPISGKQGENITKPSKNLSWWDGPTLLEGLDSLKTLRRPIHRPLRIPLAEVRDVAKVGTVSSGRIATGLLKPGMKIFFSPSNVFAEVNYIEMCRQPILQAFPEDDILFGVKDLGMEDDIKRGFVCGNAERDPPRVCLKFFAMVHVLTEKFRPGGVVNVEIHTAKAKCKLVRMLKKVDRRSGVVLDDLSSGKNMKKRECAIWEIEPRTDVVIENFREYPALGRFSVVDDETVLAEGFVIKVLKRELKK